MFLVAETMLFTGLLGGYMVLRQSSAMWPPAGQPLLPIGAGLLNLLLLGGGSAAIQQAVQGARKGIHRRLVGGITLCVLSGLAFVVALGLEWQLLAQQGLSLSGGGTYGALFYTLTGCHLLHALAVLIWVFWLLVMAVRDHFSPAHHEAVEMAAMFWHFVSLAWLGLFVILYLL